MIQTSVARLQIWKVQAFRGSLNKYRVITGIGTLNLCVRKSWLLSVVGGMDLV